MPTTPGDLRRAIDELSDEEPVLFSAETPEEAAKQEVGPHAQELFPPDRAED